MSDSGNFLTSAASSPYLPIAAGIVRGVVGMLSAGGYVWALTVTADQITMWATGIVAAGMLGWSAWQKIEAVRDKRRAEVAAARASAQMTHEAGRPMPVTVTETAAGKPNIATAVSVAEIAKAPTVPAGTPPAPAPAADMGAGIWFWIIYVIALVFGGFWGWSYGREHWPLYGVVFLLIGLVGWGVFGPPIR